ncbi:hypothetical protein B0J12DRAFT_730601 [Macrophomina phaseolina]|uniref:Polymerase/histidinol phosphatase N-terminal domain-containing protein n=1 Tax=Macrophomina phaseolina TaxID=35725 RepID=A0ABQ8G395_9PEZI|nr:hypothetical protein B0J12DRAFT_730601 [Macrophomina phaseolina]
MQDWALFQTSDPTKDNFVSAEYVPSPLLPGQDPATVQGLSVRFDQKGHERPFQKAIIVDIVDGYLNPGDKIVVRLGDRRFGARGTRAQTFVEDKFLMRWYIDPVGTSRFAAIKPDIAIPILPGPIHQIKALSPRLCWPHVGFPVHVHAEDIWGNATTDVKNIKAELRISSSGDGKNGVAYVLEQLVPSNGWTYATFADIALPDEGDYRITVQFIDISSKQSWTSDELLTVSLSSPVPRILFADLHVHSDDTVGTNDSAYNFSYAQLIAGLDIVGYTANDFNITAARWSSTLELIKKINRENKAKLLIFPGTEWCGNSAVGGDHNVVFLGDPESSPPEFPIDRRGNMARSFEWNEDLGTSAQLAPGAWPLDEVYATYAHDYKNHLLIPHVGGRRCNLGWHHPRLERLVEIGSAWGQFEWLLKDAIKRGWKMGACANSDEHRGRCGGGVPGTAVFGTKGGLTGVLSRALERQEVGDTLRARRTFATSGERLVGLLGTRDGKFLQGDDVRVPAGQTLELWYHVLGSSGFSSLEAFDASGIFYQRDLWSEAGDQTSKKIIRVTWGGARLYDRYREAVWDGKITIKGSSGIRQIEPLGGTSYVPEESVALLDKARVSFSTRTSGDYDGVNIFLDGDALPESVRISGSLGGYVKVGNVLDGNPDRPQPTFEKSFSKAGILKAGGETLHIKGGAELFIKVQAVPDTALPTAVKGSLEVRGAPKGQSRSVFFVGREWNGGKVVTSPIFLEYV